MNPTSLVWGWDYDHQSCEFFGKGLDSSGGVTSFFVSNEKRAPGSLLLFWWMKVTTQLYREPLAQTVPVVGRFQPKWA